MMRKSLHCLVVLWALLSAHEDAICMQTASDSHLLDAYQYIDSMEKLSQEEQHIQKLSLLNDSLDASSKTLELVDKAAKYAEFFTAAGILPSEKDPLLRKLETMTMQFDESVKKLNKRWPVKGMRAAVSVKSYKDKIEKAETEINAFLNNQDLPPDARKALLTLRGTGEVLKKLGNTPLIGEALEQYGEIVATLSHTLSTRYKDLAPGGKENALLNSYGVELTRGLPEGVLPTETQVLRATDWNVPLVRDGNSDTYYLKVDGQWTEVDGAEVSAIVSDWLICHYEPEGTLLERAMDKLSEAARDLRTSTEEPDSSYPTPNMIMELMANPRKRVFGTGLSRRDLREKAEEKLEEMADTRQMNTVLRGLASFEEGLLGLEQFQHIKQRLRSFAPDLGVPMTPERENNLLRSFFVNAERFEPALKKTALNLHPGSEEYLNRLGVNPHLLSLDELGGILKNYRKGLTYARLVMRVKDVDTQEPVANANVQVQLARGKGSVSFEDKENGATEKTNAEGVAELLVLMGDYRVVVGADGYQKRSPSKTASLRESKPYRASISLKKLPADLEVAEEEDAEPPEDNPADEEDQEQPAPTTPGTSKPTDDTEEKVDIATLQELCSCIFQDRLDLETRPEIRKDYPELEQEVRVVIPAGYDAETGKCVGRLEYRKRYYSWDKWYEGSFDWSRSGGIPNPPIPYLKRDPSERCCTVWTQTDSGVVCWKEAR